MKIKINRNIFWAETFVKQLSLLGVKYACISPGSRNTPLTVAFANNKDIKTFVLVDERSNGFFALGLAKSSRTPVVLVCTSGTATAEFYPAIIEAYQYRVPLIICTADRPPELLNSGANQTINQKGIYKNHILAFYDAGLPDLSLKKLNSTINLAVKSYKKSFGELHGPVHINFPFKKPFEPFDFTDEFEEETQLRFKSIKVLEIKTSSNKSNYEVRDKMIGFLYNKMKKAKRGIIIAGPDTQDNNFVKNCSELSQIFNFPVIADGASQVRSGAELSSNILVNFEGYLRSEKFINNFKPDFILHFGKTVTSKGLEIYLESLNCPRYMVNRFGDWHDPAHKSLSVLKCSPDLFCLKVLELQKKDKFINSDSSWLNSLLKAEAISEKTTRKFLKTALFPFEGKIITEMLEAIPGNSNIMISNSMPIRDLDYFLQKGDRRINIYNNRGASGIDGIISTALGVSYSANSPTFLITGDLAFYHDLNGLLAAAKYSIPLTIILIDNNGGGIFEMLPISKYEEIFQEYFITPLNIDFSSIVKAYGGKFYNAVDWESLHESLKCSVEQKSLSVIRIKTDAKDSASQRKNLWAIIARKIEAEFFGTE